MWWRVIIWYKQSWPCCGAGISGCVEEMVQIWLSHTWEKCIRILFREWNWFWCVCVRNILVRGLEFSVGWEKHLNECEKVYGNTIYYLENGLSEWERIRIRFCFAEKHLWIWKAYGNTIYYLENGLSACVLCISLVLVDNICLCILIRNNHVRVREWENADTEYRVWLFVMILFTI